MYHLVVRVILADSWIIYVILGLKEECLSSLHVHPGDISGDGSGMYRVNLLMFQGYHIFGPFSVS